MREGVNNFYASDFFLMYHKGIGLLLANTNRIKEVAGSVFDTDLNISQNVEEPIKMRPFGDH